MEQTAALLYGLNLGSVALRLGLATIMGGLIGLERATRRQVSGLRTFALLCMGSALTMVTNEYISSMLEGVDPTRIPAGAIGSIGFLGVGTIYMAGRGEVRGVTTAASLWTTVSLGIAIGAGLYLPSLIAFALVMLITHGMAYISHYQEKMNRELAMYLEIRRGDALQQLLDFFRGRGYVLKTLARSPQADALFENAVALTVELNFGKQTDHEQFLQAVGQMPGVYYVEEIS